MDRLRGLPDDRPHSDHPLCDSDGFYLSVLRNEWKPRGESDVPSLLSFHRISGDGSSKLSLNGGHAVSFFNLLPEEGTIDHNKRASLLDTEPLRVNSRQRHPLYDFQY